MNDIARSMLPARTSLGTQLLRALVQEIKTQQRPWHATPEADQKNVIERLADTVHSAVTTAALEIAARGFVSIAGTVESLTFKDGCKLVMTLTSTGDAIHKLADRVGHGALIVLADAEAFLHGMETVKPEKDQPDLPLAPPVEVAAAPDVSTPEPTPDLLPEPEPAPAPPATPQLIPEGAEL